MKTLSSAPLTALLLGACVVYHAAAPDRRTPEALRGWYLAKVGLWSGERTLATLPFLASFTARSAKSGDGTAEKLSEVGYALRYFAGTSPEFVLTGKKTPYRHLYHRDEIAFQYAASAARVQAGLDEELRAYFHALTQAGVEVVILPVPTKIAIERSWLPAKLPYALVNGEPIAPVDAEENPRAPYEAYLEAFPENVIDLDTAYRRHRTQHEDELLYVPGDTHWSSLGIALAASEVLRHLGERGFRAPRLVPRYENKLMPDPSHDLTATFQLPGWYFAQASELRWFEPVYDLLPEESREVVSTAGRVVVAGSCYSRRFHTESYGFGPLVARALGRLYVDFSLKNVPATAPLAEIAKNQVILFPGDILIWEVPMRTPPAPGSTPPLPPIDRTPS